MGGMAGFDLPWLLSAGGFALAMSASPGPNNAMVAASGANFGVVRTMPHILGVSVGFPAMFAAVALGAGGVLRAHPAIYVGLHWIGAAYLLWLAWHVATARPAAGDEARRARRARPLRFFEAALFQWANPKAWLAALSAVAAYATVDDRVSALRVLVMATLFLAVCVPCVMMWTSIGAGTARLLRTPARMRLFNLGMGLLLLASVVALLLER